MASTPIMIVGADGAHRLWTPTTLDQIGELESFLEDAIVAQPALLGLESLRTGIRQPWKVFRQINLETPTARGIEADVMLFCASGHIVIVEAKRSVNPELRDRRVIAQLLDYATSAQTLTEQDLLETFRAGSDVETDWPSLVAQWFPADEDADDLARHFRNRLERGEIHLVIACDRAPPGLATLVAALARQATTGFELDLVEIVPYVSESSPGEVLLAPRPRLATEIVARTAVTVEYRPTAGQPSTEIKTMSIDEIEEHVRAASSERSADYREWTLADIEQEVAAAGSDTMSRLLEFCKQHSYGNRIIAVGKKVNPQFGFNIPVRREKGPATPMMIFNCNARSDSIYLYFRFVHNAVGETITEEFVRRLKELFGATIDETVPEQYLKLDILAPKLVEFESVVLWLKGEAVARVATA